MSTPQARDFPREPLEAAGSPAAARAAVRGGGSLGVAGLGRWADILAPLLIVAAALPMRLANIGSYSGKGDEGIRAEQLLLMAAGFRPVKEVFASQGPLSLDIFYPFYLLLGQTLAGARLAVVVWSVLSVLAVYATARLVGGRVGGWMAAAFTIASPTYLKNSRLALVEIPAILPAIVALGAALAYQQRRERRWLVVSAAALALALAIKPMIVAVVPAVGLALLLAHLPARISPPSPPPHAGEGSTPLSRVRGRARGWGALVSVGRIRSFMMDVLIYAAVAGAILGVIVVWVGPTELYDQLVRYRVGSRAAEGWSLADNWDMLWGELQWDQPAFFALGALGGLIALALRPRAGLPLLAWGILSFALLLMYSPLGIKHAALQIPPTALLAGIGLGLLWQWVARSRDARTLGARRPAVTGLRWAAVGLSVLVVGAYGLTLPTVFAKDQQAMTVGDLGADPPYPQESLLIQSLTTPADFILVDDPYLAFLNGRKMPPWLVDTSYFRIRSGALSGADVVAHAERHHVRLMLLASDNLRQLKKFADWADERFVVVKIDERSNRKDRALYLAEDADLTAARGAVRAAIPGTVAVDGTLAGQIRVSSYALDAESVRAGGTVGLTVEWEAAGPIPLDWRQVTFLRDRSGQIVDQTERSLSGGSGGTSTWTPGRWVFRSLGLPIPAKTPPGEYTVGVGLYDSKARKLATVTAGSGVGGEEVRLGTIRVR
ncbi:MAG: glycosyltransferase family 39 protein [Chloroflexi bacterium]|nr:glycosyltransferase family 39 protein [Chloroflexota bacterium]